MDEVGGSKHSVLSQEFKELGVEKSSSGSINSVRQSEEKTRGSHNAVTDGEPKVDKQDSYPEKSFAISVKIPKHGSSFSSHSLSIGSNRVAPYEDVIPHSQGKRNIIQNESFFAEFCHKI
jgi:hypothetical protein